MGLNPETVLTEAHLLSLSKHSDVKVARLFNNIARAPEYYDLVNKLGSDLTRDLTNKEVDYLYGIGLSDDEQEKVTLFHKISFAKRLEFEKMSLFYPPSPEKVRQMRTSHEAYELYHNMLQQIKSYGSTVYSEGMNKWNDEVFEVLKGWPHILYTGEVIGTSTGINTRFIQLTCDIFFSF